MPEFGFVVAVPEGDDQEYRTSGNSLTAEQAVERCYSKYPEGRITRVLYGDVGDVDLSNPSGDTDDDSDEDTGVTSEAESSDESESDEAAEDDEAVSPPLNPSEFSVSDLTAEMDERDLSVAELEALLEAEQADDGGRKTAVAAIEEAIEDADD